MRARAMSIVAAGALVVGVLPAVLSPVAAQARTRHAVAGDFDGDGVRDLALGAPGHNHVRVKYSRSGHVRWLHANATSTMSMGFGSALASGDFNGDGYADLAVGAPDFLPPGQTGGFGNPETEGAVFEFYGSHSGLQARPLRLTGPYDGDEPYNLGAVLAAADVTRDGKADLAATLYGADSHSVSVFPGSSSGLTTLGEQDRDAGIDPESLAFGDLNGDHRPDLVAGTTTDLGNPIDQWLGAIHVFYDHSNGTLALTDQKIRGQQVGVHQGLGSAVAVGDVNGDGHADVVAGAALDSGGGSVVLLRGNSHGISAARHQRFTESRVFAHSRALDNFGWAVSVARVTSDRYADVVVGAPGDKVGSKAHAGALYLIRGASGGLTAAHHQRLTQASSGVPGTPGTGARLGSVLYAGQLLGTRNADVVAGAPDGSAGAAHGGFVLRFRGAAGGLSTHPVALIGDGTAGDHLGSSIV